MRYFKLGEKSVSFTDSFMGVSLPNVNGFSTIDDDTYITHAFKEALKAGAIVEIEEPLPQVELANTPVLEADDDDDEDDDDETDDEEDDDEDEKPTPPVKPQQRGGRRR